MQYPAHSSSPTAAENEAGNYISQKASIKRDCYCISQDFVQGLLQQMSSERHTADMQRVYRSLFLADGTDQSK